MTFSIRFAVCTMVACWLPVVSSMSCVFVRPKPMNETLATVEAVVFRAMVVREVTIPLPPRRELQSDSKKGVKLHHDVLIAPPTLPEEEILYVAPSATPSATPTVAPIPKVISIKPPKLPSMPTSIKAYVVQVQKVYKGFAIKSNERILMSSAGTCSIPLQMDKSYAFALSNTDLVPLDAASKAVLGNKSLVTKNVYIGGMVPQQWTQLSTADLAALKSFQDVIMNKPPVPVPVVSAQP